MSSRCAFCGCKTESGYHEVGCPSREDTPAATVVAPSIDCANALTQEKIIASIRQRDPLAAVLMEAELAKAKEQQELDRPPPSPPTRQRANWIGAPEFFELNQACMVLNQAFGWGSTYLVGSALQRRDYRDVDVRTMIDDARFDQIFPGAYQDGVDHTMHSALWQLVCSAISVWLSRHTGLKIDFQIQRTSNANEQFKGERYAVGIFLDQP